MPWAGCEYIRQTEQGLRENQRGLLERTVASVAASLTDAAAVDLADAEPDGRGLYVVTLTRLPTLDGYASDWLPAREPLPLLAGDRSARVLVAEYGNSLYVYVQMPADAAELNVVSVAADGLPRTLALNPRVRGERTPSIVPAYAGTGPSLAVVEPADRVFHAEIRLPMSLAERGLGIRIDAADGTPLARSFAGAEPPAPTRRSPAVEALLERYADAGLALDIIDRQRRRIAAAGTIDDGLSGARRATLLPPRLLSWILDAPQSASLMEIDIERVDGPLVDTVLSGRLASARVATSDPLIADVIALAPVRDKEVVVGAVIATQRSAAELLPGNEALQRLALVTVALTVGTIVLLAGYAAWLSHRIRRLASAADAAMDARGELTPTMPGNTDRDEIGDLARSVEALLARVRDYNAYLKALAGRLSHELATPLSVVSSSLDNLEATPLADEQQDFMRRARDGVERLRRVLAAMREATRIEDVVANATFVSIDLNELLASVSDGYRGAYPTHRFELSTESGEVLVRAAPALLVQLLDKLVDNATSFAPQGSTIDVAVQRRGAAAVIAVGNDGPTLSDEQLASIFGSLVSYRPEGGAMHMGFGLYVAALIAAGHGGRLSAHNRDDGSGVVFELTLPLA